MKKIIATENAPKAIGPYSQAVEAGGFVFISGQLPLSPQTGTMPECITAQTRQALDNLRAILREAGLELTNVVKTTVLLADMNDFGAMNEVYSGYFPTNAPARVCYEVARLPKDAAVEIEAIAVKG